MSVLLRRSIWRGDAGGRGGGGLEDSGISLVSLLYRRDGTARRKRGGRARDSGQGSPRFVVTANSRRFKTRKTAHSSGALEFLLS